jgi:hypothetical protein
VGNVLLPGEASEAGAYELIDYGSFRADAPLSSDPAHLLLSVAAGRLSDGVDERSRRALIEVIVAPGRVGPPPGLEETWRIASAVHTAASTWAARHARAGDWEAQLLLSLVGCGLLFAGRRLDHLDRVPAPENWFLAVAAVATRDYLRLPSSGPPRHPGGAHPREVFRDPPPTGETGGAWNPQAEQWLAGRLPRSQQRMGNLKLITRIVSWVFHPDEELLEVAPCRYRDGEQGSALLVVSDRALTIARMDGSPEPAVINVIEHRHVLEARSRTVRRAKLFPGISLEIRTATDTHLIRDLIPRQARTIAAVLPVPVTPEA